MWTTRSRSTSRAASASWSRAGESEDVARRIAEAEFGDVRASRRELAAVDRRRLRRERARDGSTRSRTISG